MRKTIIKFLSDHNSFPFICNIAVECNKYFFPIKIINLFAFLS